MLTEKSFTQGPPSKIYSTTGQHILKLNTGNHFKYPMCPSL